MRFARMMWTAAFCAAMPILPMAAPAQQAPSKVTWQAGLKTQVEWWVLRRQVYHHSYYFGLDHRDRSSIPFVPSPTSWFVPR